MSRRISLASLVAAVALLAIPAGAMADPTTTTGLSVVDAISTDTALDGSSESSSSAVKAAASDSPAKDTYSEGKTPVPPPVDCSGADVEYTDTSSSSSSASGSGSGASAVKTDTCTTIVECSAADTDGKNAAGQPCVSTSTDCVDGATVCGGGGVEEAPEDVPGEPVAGGGEPDVAPIETVGGGGPELPFTGLPLWYAIYGGLALVFGGIAFWLRARTSGPRI
ncbi:MAG: hypothetical protein JWO69_1285 [Thermoleophilia bacterium]|jgi:opacity protein-like surface antigen|nr:hypothetical protein [Thermoleophilia bacterium]